MPTISTPASSKVQTPSVMRQARGVDLPICEQAMRYTPAATSDSRIGSGASSKSVASWYSERAPAAKAKKP